MDSIFKDLANLVTKSYDMTDEVLAAEAKKITDKIPANLLVHCRALDNVLRRRVMAHCKLNKIKPEEYQGPLPFRVFKIENKQ